mgnify:CR=1 FL=1
MGPVSVYPHLELDQRPYTQTEMRDLVEKLKALLPKLKILIYKQSTYCYEVNGPWNVCFQVYDPKKDTIYTYMIRSCDDFNNDYIKLGTMALTKEVNEPLFYIIESKLIELVHTSKKVNYFDT